mmetsp:Transcript_2832/g.3921  ORF Transcript_2832/g.3921 Transcript_2832/m.3921 type:complete len:609 (+) Transcript_2832:207-2033(+)
MRVRIAKCDEEEQSQIVSIPSSVDDMKTKKKEAEWKRWLVGGWLPKSSSSLFSTWYSNVQASVVDKKEETAEEELARAVRALQRTCLLQHTEDSALWKLANKLERIEFKEGEQIGVAQGEAQDALYVLIHGSVVREHIREDGLAVQKVDEGTGGMGDEVMYWVGGKMIDEKRAEISVRGPDVNGLLSSMARALFSCGAKIVEARAETPVSDDGETYRAETRFVIELSSNHRMDKTVAKRLAETVKDACESSRLGELRTAGLVNSFGTLHVVSRVPAFATTIASSDGVAYRLSADILEREISTNGHFAIRVVSGLCAEVFRMSESYAPTPLFDQLPRRVNVAAVSVAAAFEAYYRSMLNAVLNSSLSGSTGATLFPNMHLQIPTRVAYINGFKFFRQALSDQYPPGNIATDNLSSFNNNNNDHTISSPSKFGPYAKLIPALLPGVLMTPLSSLLEAYNAGHANPEPLWRRSFRGTSLRCLREVIFGLGLNNLSDFFEDAVPSNIATSKIARNMLGSLASGIIAGYFSHVPHNLSTLKMLEPHKSYSQHWRHLVDIARETRLPPALPPRSAFILANILTLFLPAGLAIRTTQIVGSFCLLNGITELLDRR